MSRLLQRVIQRKGYVSSVNQTAQRRTERMWLTEESVEEERESVLAANSTVVQAKAANKENETTRLSAEEAAAEAAASVTAALDCWQAAETSRRGALEGQKEVSRGPLHRAQRESDEVLGILLQSVENCDKQTHSITMREDSSVFGADGRFRN